MSKRATPNPDEIYIPDPGANVVVYKGECYSRTDGRGPINILPGYQDGYNTCVDCFAMNPTPTPTPTQTYPAPAVVGFPVDIKAYMEGLSAMVEVTRTSGFYQSFMVEYIFTPMDATRDIDYYRPEGDRGILIFAPDENIKTIPINLMLDYDLTEPAEYLHVTLLSADGIGSRTSAIVDPDRDTHIIQIEESGLPPPTTILANDEYDVDGTLTNIRFIADTGESAVINLYPDRARFPLDYYIITIANDGGKFVWDKNAIISPTSHRFEQTPPEDYDFTFHFVPAAEDLSYTIRYLGEGSFYFSIIAPPIPTPVPLGFSDGGTNNDEPMADEFEECT